MQLDDIINSHDVATRSSLFNCRNACGVAERTDMISYHDVVTAENWGAIAAATWSSLS